MELLLLSAPLVALVADVPALAIITVVGLVIVQQIFTFFTTVDSGEMDKATAAYLEGKVTGPDECAALVESIEGAPWTEDEATCAEQMRSVLVAKHLPYSKLIEDPGTLLRCSQSIANNGGLWTRFTVQFNLFGGSIVAAGSDEQRAALVASQDKGILGCFAFTEKGAGVLSGAGVESTATFDPETDEFVITSPTPSSTKNWISQGMYAEEAVILAELVVGGESKGPHLFWAPIATRAKRPAQRPTPLPGVTVESLPEKACMRGLDNAAITFKNFRVPRASLLNRFCALEPAPGGKKGEFAYETKLPDGIPRMLDLLIFRLLTGRIQLSEGTIAHAQYRLRHSWAYCQTRELWRGRKPKGKMMAEMPLIKAAFRDYGRTLAVVNAFIQDTREVVADAVMNSNFTNDVVEATVMCKFVGTGFGVDCASAVRKVMGARALQEDSLLGKESLLPNATSAAEGDNTIMELKVVQDVVRGRTPKVPLGLLLRVCGDARGRKAAWHYATRFAKAAWLGRAAMSDGPLLRDLAWARAHLRVVDVWLKATAGDPAKRAWLDSYDKILMVFPGRLQN